MFGSLELEGAKSSSTRLRGTQSDPNRGNSLHARFRESVRSGAPEPSPLTSQEGHTVTNASNDRAYCMIANFSDEALIIPKATVLRIAERIPETPVDIINARSHENVDPPTKP